MRPIRLRFSGLRSYRQETDIVFDDLELFAVIGDTGAGKSTIIEAICLALYAKKTWTGALTEVIADGMDIMRVEFTFEADGHRWTALRSRRRNATAPVDLLRSETNRVPDLNGARAVNEAIEDLLGLSFEQFTRAVVMPQGRFDVLLRASSTDRNKILKSLLGLGQMTAAAAKVVEYRNEVRPIHERYVERRRLLPTDPTGDLARAKAELAAAEARRDGLRAAVDSLAEPTRIQEAVAGVRSTVAVNLAALPEPPVKTVETLQSSHRAGVELLAEFAEADAAAKEAGRRAAVADDAIRETLAGFRDRDALTLAEARIGDAMASLDEQLEAFARAREALARVGDEPPVEIDPVFRQEEAAAGEALEMSGARLTAARDAVAAAQRHWEQLVAVRKASRTAHAAANDASVQAASARGAVAVVETDLADSAQQVTSARELLERARFANQVASVAEGHGPGDPCPVCDQSLPERFSAPQSADIEAAQGQLDEAEKRHRALEASHRTTLAAATRADADVEQKQLDLDRCVSAEHAAEEQARKAGVILDATDAAAAVATLSEDLNDVADTHRKAVERSNAATRARTVAETERGAERKRHAERVASAEAAVSGARRLVERCIEPVGTLPPVWRPGAALTADSVSVSDLEPVRTALANAAVGVDRHLAARRIAEDDERAAKERGALVTSRAGELVTQPASTALQTLNGYLSRVRDASKAGRAAVEMCALPVDMPNSALDDVQFNVKTEQLPAVIETVEARLKAAQVVVDAAWVVAETLDEMHITATATITTTLKSVGCATTGDLHREYGEARRDVDQGTVQVAAAATHMSDVAAVDEVLTVVGPLRDNLDVLCAALTDRQFIDYLLGLREAELLAEASRRLRTITGDRFGFVADFGVKNIGSGEIRSPDSLSGGERFQASLALALALVEIASRGGGRLDAVFVDEGFGSLDSNSLEAALDTLGKVAGGGKTVALISHLRPVAEYVDTVMHVTKDEVFGSQIRTLDETERTELLDDDARSRLTS